MEAVQKLEKLGYNFEVVSSNIKFKHIGSSQPNPAQVKPLLEELKAHKPEALVYLQPRAAGETGQDPYMQLFQGYPCQTEQAP